MMLHRFLRWGTARQRSWMEPYEHRAAFKQGLLHLIEKRVPATAVVQERPNGVHDCMFMPARQNPRPAVSKPAGR
jgi:hypothetical protein